jgi:hypothetical protein
METGGLLNEENEHSHTDEEEGYPQSQATESLMFQSQYQHQLQKSGQSTALNREQLPRDWPQKEGGKGAELRHRQIAGTEGGLGGSNRAIEQKVPIIAQSNAKKQSQQQLLNTDLSMVSHSVVAEKGQAPHSKA